MLRGLENIFLALVADAFLLLQPFEKEVGHFWMEPGWTAEQFAEITLAEELRKLCSCEITGEIILRPHHFVWRMLWPSR